MIFEVSKFQKTTFLSLETPNHKFTKMVLFKCEYIFSQIIILVLLIIYLLLVYIYWLISYLFITWFNFDWCWLISSLLSFYHLLLIYYNELRGFGAEAPKPRSIVGLNRSRVEGLGQSFHRAYRRWTRVARCLGDHGYKGDPSGPEIGFCVQEASFVHLIRLGGGSNTDRCISGDVLLQ